MDIRDGQNSYLDVCVFMSSLRILHIAIVRITLVQYFTEFLHLSANCVIHIKSILTKFQLIATKLSSKDCTLIFFILQPHLGMVALFNCKTLLVWPGITIVVCGHLSLKSVA